MTTPNTEELRKLLESAAKACGIDAEALYPKSQPDVIYANGQEWQPHLPGLDSQVLAAELGIGCTWLRERVMCVSRMLVDSEYYADHPSKAHAQAMAVLRVAAAIGEAI